MTRTPLFAAMVVMASSLVYAQDTPKAGVTMSAPTAIGVLWQVTDGFALRPEINVTHSTGESSSSSSTGTSSSITSDDSTGVGVALSALVYVARKDALRTYISPKFTYSRTSSMASSTTTGSTVSPATSQSTTSNYSTSGSLGAQYSFGRRIGIFGELGVVYTRSNSDITSTFTVNGFTIVNGVLTQTAQQQVARSAASSNQISTRTAVGVIVFF